LASCGQSPAVNTSKRAELFSLSYGSFEDEINLFTLPGRSDVNTHITMRDGFFYISNGAQKKVMHLNSYGDLLAVYYNPENNPRPAFATDPEGEDGYPGGELSTQKAIPYPFENPGALAADSDKNIYVVDTLPPERIDRDAAGNLRLSQVVLRFSGEGVFMDYLGQRGPGGMPFPWIQNIYTTKNNELVVVCRTNTGMNVYWFSSNGFLLYMLPIEKAALPNLTGSPGSVYLSLEQIVPDTTLRRLYLKIDYYTSVIDPASKVQSGIEYAGAYLCPMDVPTGDFLAPIAVPPFESAGDGNGSPRPITYDLLGLTDSGWFFFSAADSGGYSLQMLHPRDQTVLKRHLDVDTAALAYYSFALSEQGILSALLAEKDGAKIVWWRTDNVIDALLKK
jgi:hypothetical protein